MDFRSLRIDQMSPQGKTENDSGDDDDDMMDDIDEDEGR